MRLALCGVPLIVVALWSGAGRAQDQALQVEKVTQLNKEALADLDRGEWNGAKKKLLEALVLAKKAGLDGHPLTARTFVHLGVVYVMGFKDRNKGMQSFRRAFEIQPDIQLTRGIATLIPGWPAKPNAFAPTCHKAARRCSSRASTRASRGGTGQSRM